MLIQRCLSIEYLNFAGVMAFHNDALIVAIIRTSPNLRHLEIGYNDIGDEVTETLAHTCHKLEHLELSGCSFQKAINQLNPNINIENFDKEYYSDSESFSFETESESE
ncbi:F-box/LRR-repeat protein 15 [Rhizophagus irregularis DAOM 181602=DAOM 197198]|nr:F-box/LRR-repeat protein 15 [Rhizophagus irregularis DAOM 181602=DAOM 197198]